MYNIHQDKPYSRLASLIASFLSSNNIFLRYAYIYLYNASNKIIFLRMASFPFLPDFPVRNDAKLMRFPLTNRFKIFYKIPGLAERNVSLLRNFCSITNDKGRLFGIVVSTFDCHP